MVISAENTYLLANQDVDHHYLTHTLPLSKFFFALSKDHAL